MEYSLCLSSACGREDRLLDVSPPPLAFFNVAKLQSVVQHLLQMFLPWNGKHMQEEVFHFTGSCFTGIKQQEQLSGWY